MTRAEKLKVWEYIKKHSPDQASFLMAASACFGKIDLISYRATKSPSPGSNGLVEK